MMKLIHMNMYTADLILSDIVEYFIRYVESSYCPFYQFPKDIQTWQDLTDIPASSNEGIVVECLT